VSSPRILSHGLSDEDLAKAAAADDAIQKMKASFGAIVDRVAVEFAPVFQQAAESVASMIPYIDGIAEAFASALDMAGSFWTKTQDYLTDVLTVAAVVVNDMSTLWEGLFEDIPKFGKAAFDWLAANAGTMIENLGKMMRNLLNSVNHTGMQLGEEIAFQLGLSDEVLNIEATQSEQMTALTDFVMPQLSAETTQVMTDVSDALQVNEESRAKRDAANKMEANKTNVLAPSSVLDPTVGSVPEAKQLQSAGVMQRGSAEAFSTIVKSMMGGKDPVVAATEKQTKELVKELKANKPPKLVFAAEF